MKNNEAQYHSAYGRHSLIPGCCIKFFVEEWSPFFETKWYGTAYEEIIHESKFNYVPCPRCFFTDNLVKIRICREECGKDCYNDFWSGETI